MASPRISQTPPKLPLDTPTASPAPGAPPKAGATESSAPAAAPLDRREAPVAARQADATVFSAATAPQPAAPKAAGTARPAPFAAPPPYLEVSVDLGNGGERRLDAELYDRWPASYRNVYRQLTTDPAIRAVAERAARVRGGRPVPVTFFVGGEVSHFDGQALHLQLSGRPGEEALGPKEFRNTAVHELAHLLQNALYEGWLPKHDYTGTNPLEKNAAGHWLDKATTASTAWSEGFPEGLAAFYAGDFRLDAFKHRERIYMGTRNPKDTSTLDRTEGYVASVLVDFWSPRGDTARLERSLDVLRIQERRNMQTERHQDLDAYLSEHLRRYPEDRTRLHLVLKANSMLQSGARYLGTPSDGERQGLDALDKTLERLADRHGTPEVAAALQAVITRSAKVPESSAALERAVARELSRQRGPVFENALLAARPYETMPLAELKKAVENAERAYDAGMQAFGYSTHPQVKELDELRKTLGAIYRRRGGR